MQDPRCAVWGMNHLDTIRAVELFLTKGYLDMFLRGAVRDRDEPSEEAKGDEDDSD